MTRPGVDTNSNTFDHCGPLARKYGVIGTPEQCAEQLDRFARARCHYFVMNPIGDPQDEREQLEAIASEVIPRTLTVA